MILRIKKLHQTAQLSYTHNDSQSVRVCNITKVMLYFLRDVGLFLRLMLTIVLLSQLYENPDYDAIVKTRKKGFRETSKFSKSLGIPLFLCIFRTFLLVS